MIRQKIKIFLLLSALLVNSFCFFKSNKEAGRLNYIEYRRGKSFFTSSDIGVNFDNNKIVFYDVGLKDESFFPDNSIIPNAFLEPLFTLKIEDAVKAFTEPYYSYRFVHFLKKNPKIGLGVEFIHLKVFIKDYNQMVRVSGVFNGENIDDTVKVGDFLPNLNVSHGVNHASIYLEYREMFFRNNKIKDGKLQPYVNLSLGLCVPHFEARFLSGGKEIHNAYSFQFGWANLGMGMGIGLRFRPFRGFGFNLEYKLTYSFLQDMYFDTDKNSSIKMDFYTSQLLWGISFIF